MKNPKIENTELTQAHIGRSVVYGSLATGFVTPERGVITSFNAMYVFVRYGSSMQSQATRPEDLRWEIKP